MSNDTNTEAEAPQPHAEVHDGAPARHYCLLGSLFDREVILPQRKP